MELEYFILYKCGNEIINTTITTEKIETKKDICKLEKQLEQVKNKKCVLLNYKELKNE